LNKRKIAVITGSRSEFGILQSVIERIIASNFLTLHLYVTGMHLLPKFGKTIEEIKRNNYPNLKEIQMYEENVNSEKFIGYSVSTATKNFTEAFFNDSIEIVLLLGDRVEMLAAGVAAASLNLPIAHIHGGDVSENAQIDEQIRHSLTKMSHLHFTATKLSEKRILQMGEEKWRVYNTGSPSIDNIVSFELFSKRNLINELGLSDLIKDRDELILLVQHPSIFEAEKSGIYINEILECLKRLNKHTIAIYPNNDPGNQLIIDELEKIKGDSFFHIFTNLNRKIYLSILKNAYFMIGNSSSGMIESASFNLPTLNVGIRNLNRESSDNVLTVENGIDNIWDGIQKITSPEFLKICKNVSNIYGNGSASESIVKVLEQTELNFDFFKKKFILR
jgi:UDP-hydrolysing UDP-N-acetyl-D-glucosamine 2-epimerase